jgi:hypothetical protein
MPTVLPGIWLLTRHFRMPARCCRLLDGPVLGALGGVGVVHCDEGSSLEAVRYAPGTAQENVPGPCHPGSAGTLRSLTWPVTVRSSRSAV